MPTFPVSAGSTTFTLDSAGTIAAPAPGGTWTIDRDGKLLLQPTGQPAQTVAVEWKFSAENHLCLGQAGKVVCDFHAAPAAPQLRLVDNVLQVKPNLAGAFEFAVPFTWNLDEKYNLQATLGGTTSTLEGWVDDKRSRLVFWFFDRAQTGRPPTTLIFVGSWEKNANADGRIQLVFRYVAREQPASFVLPGDCEFKNNRLVLSYQKAGVSRSVELQGSLQISPNFDVVFTIAQQTTSTGGVVTKETRISVATSFEMTNLAGGLELSIVAQNAANARKLVIAGAFKGRIGANGNLDLAFSYASAATPGQSATLAIGVNGTFALGSNGQLKFSYQRAADGQTITVSGQGQLGSVTLTGGGTIVQTPGGPRQVTAFLGLAW